MTRSAGGYLTKRWYDSITGNRNILREMERAVNVSGELDKAMKKAMGLDLDKAMGLVGKLDLAARDSVTNAIIQESQAATKSYDDLMRAQRGFAEAAQSTYPIGLDPAHLRAMGVLIPPLSRLVYGDLAAVRGFTESLASARLLAVEAPVFARWVRESFDSCLGSLYAPPVQVPLRTPSEWIEEELDLLLLSTPEYKRSKLAWILAIFVPRLRLGLYQQDQEGDFEGVMEEFWEELVQDPEVRARLRERLEKSGVREELRKSLSNHLGKIEEGELEYAILGLYAHIEGFLAEIACQRKLVPHPEFILCPQSGQQIQRRGVHDLIEVLHRGGRLSESQQRFLKYVLSNEYDSNRVRHGLVYKFSKARATALVLALILALCLAWDMEVPELLEPDQEQN